MSEPNQGQLAVRSLMAERCEVEDCFFLIYITAAAAAILRRMTLLFSTTIIIIIIYLAIRQCAA